MAQSLTGTLDGLYALCVSTYAASTAPGDGSPVLVSYGQPGQYEPQAIVAVMDVQPSTVTRPTLGTQRSRELALDVSVMFSVYTPGGNEAHVICLDAVANLIRLLENSIRVQGAETLSGGCRDSWVSGINGPTGQVVYDPESVQSGSPVPSGRVVEATATVTALIRY